MNECTVSMTAEKIAQDDFLVEVIRSARRRTITLLVREGEVYVRVPQKLARRRIVAVIERKAGWIRRKLEEHREIVLRTQRSYDNGDSFTYLGRRYRLQLLAAEVDRVKLKRGELQVHSAVNKLDSDTVKSLLADWYLQRAENYLKRRAMFFAATIGVTPRSVVVRHYKSRWGSCSAAGDIRFNWEIILAPAVIVDYLVIHELCHLLEHNHSAAFWLSVQQQCPDYREHRAWLKRHGRMLKL